MTVSLSENGKRLGLALKGTLTGAEAHRLVERMLGKMTGLVTIDMKSVDAVHPSAIYVLLAIDSTLKSHGGKLCVINAPRRVVEDLATCM